MPRAETKAERSPLNDILSLSITSITNHLQKEGMEYWIVVQRKGVSLNLHANAEWSLKSEEDNEVFPIFKGQTLENGLGIDELLPAYAKLMHHSEILERANKKDRKHARRMKKYVNAYVEKNKPMLRQGFIASVIDAMGRINRTEPISL